MSTTQTPAAADTTQASEHLMFAMRRALVERRQVIEIGDFKFRFQRRGETFEDGDRAFEALESGVFVLLPGESGGRPIPGRWVHYGSTDDLPVIMKQFVGDMDIKQLEEVRVTIAANAALQSLNADRAAARQQASVAPSTMRDPLLFKSRAAVPAEYASSQYQVEADKASACASVSSSSNMQPRRARP